MHRTLCLTIYVQCQTFIIFTLFLNFKRKTNWCDITVLMCNLFLWLTGLYVNRMVNTCLAEEMKEIHAFEQKTLTPEQWDKQNAQWHPHYFHLNKWCISDMEHEYKLNSSGNHHAVDHSVAIIKLLYDVFWRLFEYFLSQKVHMSFITEIVQIPSSIFQAIQNRYFKIGKTTSLQAMHTSFVLNRLGILRSLDR